MPVHAWIRRVWLAGFDVECREIEGGISPERVGSRENLWIQKIPNLVNVRGNRYDFFWDYELLEKIKSKCQKKIKYIEDNYNGFHGIRYHKGEDAFTARIAFGYEDSPCWIRQVEGDDLPGRPYPHSSPIWFDDANRAIEARNRQRESITATIKSGFGPRVLRERGWDWPLDELP